MPEDPTSCETPNSDEASSTTTDASQMTLPAKRPAPDSPKFPGAEKHPDSDLPGLPTSTADAESSGEEDRPTKRSSHSSQKEIEGQEIEEEEEEEAHDQYTSDKLARWDDKYRFGIRIDSDKVLTAHQNLERHIAHWFWRYFENGLDWNNVRDCDKNMLSTWAPNARLWLESEFTSDVHNMISAWVWRIIWEQQISPEAPADKWKSPIWAAFGKVKAALASGIDDPYSAQSIHYKSSTHSFARLLYMQHGEHSDPVRLAHKIQEPFKHLMKFHDQESSNFCLKMAKEAIFIDFQVQFTLSPLECLWHDPYTKRSLDFPFKNPETHIDFMECHLHSGKLPPGPEGYTVDFIGRPLFRWLKHVTTRIGNGPEHAELFKTKQIGCAIPLVAMIR